MKISHGAFNGNVTTFNNFRADLAKTIGIENLYDMEYYKLTGGEKWDSYLHDPLHKLLIKGDADGVIKVSDLKQIVERIQEISPELEKKMTFETANQFIKGAKLALKKNEMLRFRG